MSATILYWGILVSQIMLAISMLLSAGRLVLGPRAQDRVMGIDTLYVTTMMMFMIFGIRSGVSIYFEAALIIGLLGFVSSVALAKFLMRGEVIE